MIPMSLTPSIRSTAVKRTFLLAAGALALAACSRGDAASVEIETSAVERRDIGVDAQATRVIEPVVLE